MAYLPSADGVTHINVYTKGKTELGRMLSNLHSSDTNIEIDGEVLTFKTLEGFWYFLVIFKALKIKHYDFLDLDGFKAVNDTWGHDIGDLLLQTVAQRLRRLLRQGDMASRLGGDEFTALLRDIDDVSQLQRIATRIIDSINAPLVLRGCTVQVGVSIGIALFPRDAQDFLALIKAADTAMYAAKQGGKNRYCFAEHLMQAPAVGVGGVA